MKKIAIAVVTLACMLMFASDLFAAPVRRVVVGGRRAAVIVRGGRQRISVGRRLFFRRPALRIRIGQNVPVQRVIVGGGYQNVQRVVVAGGGYQNVQRVIVGGGYQNVQRVVVAGGGYQNVQRVIVSGGYVQQDVAPSYVQRVVVQRDYVPMQQDCAPVQQDNVQPDYGCSGTASPIRVARVVQRVRYGY